MKTNNSILMAAAFLRAVFTAADSAFAETWTFSSPTPYGSYSMASSVDGSKVVAGQIYGGPIYTSTNSGETWTLTGVPSIYGWLAVASSADGTILTAVGEYAPVYTSTNSGATWTSNILAGYPYAGYWISAASSADGRTLMVAGDFGPIYISTNSGVAWTSNSTPDADFWVSIACSADGTKLVLMGADAAIWTSTNLGATWNQATKLPDPTDADVCSVVSSADGNKLVASVNGKGDIHINGFRSHLGENERAADQLDGSCMRRPMEANWWRWLVGPKLARFIPLQMGEQHGYRTTLPVNNGPRSPRQQMEACCW